MTKWNVIDSNSYKSEKYIFKIYWFYVKRSIIDTIQQKIFFDAYVFQLDIKVLIPTRPAIAKQLSKTQEAIVKTLQLFIFEFIYYNLEAIFKFF